MFPICIYTTQYIGLGYKTLIYSITFYVIIEFCYAERAGGVKVEMSVYKSTIQQS